MKRPSSESSTSLSPQGRGTGAQRQGEGRRAKNAGNLLARARMARQEMTEAEERLWSRLRDRRLGGHKFRRQRPMGRVRPDFVCLQAKLIVEVDGSQHVDDAAADARRTVVFHRDGFRVLRVWNNDVLAQTEAVLEAILIALRAPHPAACGGCPSPLRGEVGGR